MRRMIRKDIKRTDDQYPRLTDDIINELKDNPGKFQGLIEMVPLAIIQIYIRIKLIIQENMFKVSKLRGKKTRLAIFLTIEKITVNIRVARSRSGRLPFIVKAETSSRSISTDRVTLI